jgi:myo-inositol-1(or 4)-monophosphatase
VNDASDSNTVAYSKFASDLLAFFSGFNFEFDVVEWKLDGSPVSDVDISIQEFIRELTLKYLGDYDLLSEETEIPFSVNGNYVVVDPIDGTENFISGIPIWGTGVAFFEENTLKAGIVVFPELRIAMYSSLIEIEDTFKFRVFREASQSRVQAFSSNSNWESAVASFEAENRIFGCSLFNLLLAATGAINFHASTKGVMIWDIAPALVFALERDHKVFIDGKRYFGEFLNPYERYVVEIQS